MIQLLRIMLLVVCILILALLINILASLLTPAHAADRQAVLDLARTVWAEARGESAEGQRAVAHVVVNRVDAGFGRTVSEVVRQKHQFAPWTGAASRKRLMKLTDSTPGFILAKAAAAIALCRCSPDPTGGALYFTNHRIRPAWSRHMSVIRIGNHAFYRGRAR